MIKVRHFGIVIVFTFFGWCSWKLFDYFFDNSCPFIICKDLKEGEYYAGKKSFLLSSNKKVYATVWCDDTCILEDQYIVPNKLEYNCNFETNNFKNGFHRIKIKYIDRTFARNESIKEIGIHIDNEPLKIALLDYDEEVKKIDQGKTLFIRFISNKNLSLAKVKTVLGTYTAVKESKNSTIYECFIPIDCQEKPSRYTLHLECIDSVKNKIVKEKMFDVVAYEFKKEVLTINQTKIEEEKEIGKLSKEFESMMVNICKESPQKKLWKGDFCTPIDIQRITCEFGTIRTTQHKGRYMHKALDVINIPKSVVWSTQDGIVVLKDRFADTGNTVVIDHGCGVTSLFFHLDDFAEIKVGQKIVQGNPIGNIGKTGYATGYHLHWEMRVNNIAVDPMQWTKL